MGRELCLTTLHWIPSNLQERWRLWNSRAASQWHPQEHSLRAKAFCPWDPARWGPDVCRVPAIGKQGACRLKAWLLGSVNLDSKSQFYLFLSA